MAKETLGNYRSSDSSDVAATKYSGAQLARNNPDLSGSVEGLENVKSMPTICRTRTPECCELDGKHVINPRSHLRTGEHMIVEFDGPDDPYQPLNWSFSKKAITTILYGFTAMVSTEVATLGTLLLLFALGLGPLIWAPISEMYGRKPAVVIPYFFAAVFSFATATAKDIQTVMITRFFTGFFGSAPVTNCGGVLGDIWTPEQRGAARVIYSLAVFGGPVLGPIVGGAISQSNLGWRWTEYLTGIMMMVFAILDILIVDESYPPVLLKYTAQRLRFETGNSALHAHHEEWNFTWRDFGKKYLLRPLRLLITPICFFVALYASFVYAILYLSLAAFPIIFQDIRGWNQVVGALPFLAYFIGISIGAVINLANQNLA
ncbi:uncharacterized protein N7483_009863 [Penicillium malachiteum]|uniref:uncharacterized protein n=1 Tax=Penicillium malachiteum TaxID=1324776 RepID=UPI002549BDE5|nr:uncharacterized protein N7483_009863 [Penicillium malachiteum]KAJ5721929.1 hypothetical protein N7483_009863 [Penicillium malachiteum]